MTAYNVTMWDIKAKLAYNVTIFTNMNIRIDPSCKYNVNDTYLLPVCLESVAYSLMDSSRISTFFISIMLIIYGSFRSRNIEKRSCIQTERLNRRLTRVVATPPPR
ncbi:PREDICTED: uncharacterized protein LOC106818053 [Priapulus caudatus]|uniref:Uncharacterized protein LOC106818053 n=1 Tax=Priapulus caudatus TaxID=37621 RepID=A0ABM1F1E1_PRICU|nr:PREDICTED: uncharacterized protein LOC106818053 [Priapulus caudatus]